MTAKWKPPLITGRRKSHRHRFPPSLSLSVRNCNLYCTAVVSEAAPFMDVFLCNCMSAGAGRVEPSGVPQLPRELYISNIATIINAIVWSTTATHGWPQDNIQKATSSTSTRKMHRNSMQLADEAVSVWSRTLAQDGGSGEGEKSHLLYLL